MTSVVRRSGLTLEMPATYLPSHFRRNLKFLYGSTRLGFTVKFAMGAAVRRSVLPARNPSVKSPFPAEPRAHHSSPTLPRCALCFARCFLAWIIRTFWPRLFWRVWRRHCEPLRAQRKKAPGAHRREGVRPLRFQRDGVTGGQLGRGSA